MFVAPQDQFYIETNLAYLLIDAICLNAHTKLAKVAAAAKKLNLLIYPPTVRFHQKTYT